MQCFAEKSRQIAKLLNEPGTVVHLHGAISKPETMIVTTKEYLEHYDNENVQEFLGELFEKKLFYFLDTVWKRQKYWSIY